MCPRERERVKEGERGEGGREREESISETFLDKRGK